MTKSDWQTVRLFVRILLRKVTRLCQTNFSSFLATAIACQLINSLNIFVDKQLCPCGWGLLSVCSGSFCCSSMSLFPKYEKKEEKKKQISNHCALVNVNNNQGIVLIDSLIRIKGKKSRCKHIGIKLMPMPLQNR